MDKTIIGLVEPVILADASNKRHTVLAKIDTGADSSSIDMTLASKLSLGPITKTKSVISSHGRSLRPVIKLDIELRGKRMSADFTLYNRAHMTSKMLIGKNVLRKGFLIDPSLEVSQEADDESSGD